jgi:outer membrane protein assembly factor BamD (BamD/ComL family)
MRRWLLGTVVLIWMSGSSFSFGAAKIYSKAVQFAKAGQGHFAFMQYNNLLRNYPMSPYRNRALFATGEYYYQVADLREAEVAFKMFLNENPDSEERLYALAYLLSIAVKNISPVEHLEREIMNLQQVSLIFRESKEITYRSPLYQDYKTVIHIDRIEFYMEGKLFAKVSY